VAGRPLTRPSHVIAKVLLIDNSMRPIRIGSAITSPPCGPSCLPPFLQEPRC